MSVLQHFFGFNKQTMNVRTEIIAGITTFLTMSYILAVNPAILGTSAVTTYVESAAGVAEGGRSGLTAFVTGLLFLVALFFSPVFLLIPGAATTGALVLVGVLMMGSIHKIDMSDLSEALPSFVTIIMVALTYSIADGMILGLLCYVLVKLFSGKHRDISLTMYILAGLFILNFIFA